MKTLCIYHGNCADGFGAAWVVRQALGADVEFVPAVYGQPAPDVQGKDVIIVDFSYPYDVLVELSRAANSILILDHHKTAQEDLKRLFFAGRNYQEFVVDCAAECACNNAPHIGALFDMERSGAGLAWDFFFPNRARPALINHIEDRDLWQFKLEGTRDVMAAVFSHPQDFATWDLLMADHINALRMDGHAIERKQQKDVANLVTSNSRPMIIGGITVPAVNLPHTMASDAGHLLSQGQPFAAIYWDTPDGRSFSLRSTDAGEDVSAIAKQYGGGGHRNAAGLKVPFDHELACFATTRILTCVYCAHEYPQHTPAAGDRVLTDHIRTCAKHPMRQAQQAITKLHSALAGLLGESTPQGLAQLEVGLKLVPMPATEKAIMIAAINALRDTSALITSGEVQP
jgi:oligoribonuclease NrnB/cAMP/cGMP phosphodiesterase (DHH superfamily)